MNESLRGMADDRLLELIAHGDGAAFAAFYRRHHAEVLTFLLRRTRDRELSHDLTAETFFVATRGAARCPGADAGDWLEDIARERWQEHSRARGQAHGTALRVVRAPAEPDAESCGDAG